MSLDSLLAAIEAEDERQMAEVVIRGLVDAGMRDPENMGLYAAAAQRLRDRLRADKVTLR